jgi:hypothetical protein
MVSESHAGGTGFLSETWQLCRDISTVIEVSLIFLDLDVLFTDLTDLGAASTSVNVVCEVLWTVWKLAVRTVLWFLGACRLVSFEFWNIDIGVAVWTFLELVEFLVVVGQFALVDWLTAFFADDVVAEAETFVEIELGQFDVFLAVVALLGGS